MDANDYEVVFDGVVTPRTFTREVEHARHESEPMRAYTVGIGDRLYATMLKNPPVTAEGLARAAKVSVAAARNGIGRMMAKGRVVVAGHGESRKRYTPVL